MKNKITKENLFKIIIPVSVLVIFACSYFYSIGYQKAESEIYNYLASDSYINDCDKNGCYVDLPKNDFGAGYIPCDDNHYCLFEGKTDQQKKKDGEINKMDEDIRNNLNGKVFNKEE